MLHPHFLCIVTLLSSGGEGKWPGGLFLLLLRKNADCYMIVKRIRRFVAFWLAFLRQITWRFCGRGGVEEGIEGDGWLYWRGKCGRMVKSEQGRARDDGKGLSLRVGTLREVGEIL